MGRSTAVGAKPVNAVTILIDVIPADIPGKGIDIGVRVIAIGSTARTAPITVAILIEACQIGT
jgi:hypothetical protein